MSLWKMWVEFEKFEHTETSEDITPAPHISLIQRCIECTSSSSELDIRIVGRIHPYPKVVIIRDDMILQHTIDRIVRDE